MIFELMAELEDEVCKVLKAYEELREQIAFNYDDMMAKRKENITYYHKDIMLNMVNERDEYIAKQEKLLELYKELEQLNNDFFFNRLPIDKYAFKNVEIYGKIKELENEV